MQTKDLLPWARREGSPELKGSEDNPIAALQREMNRAFESFWNRAERPFGGLAGAFGEGAPRSDVVETEAGIEVTVELPGLEEKDIEVSLSDDALSVKGEKKVERKDEKKGYYISERSYGSIYRSIPLPAGIDSEKAEATFRNGVLTVRLPAAARGQGQGEEDRGEDLLTRTTPHHTVPREPSVGWSEPADDAADKRVQGPACPGEF